jgi:hypothetical protein
LSEQPNFYDVRKFRSLQAAYGISSQNQIVTDSSSN